jgi:PAS domain S-box-containing protein
MQVFFNQAPDLLCIIQPDGTFGQTNAAWKSLLDWTPEALHSRHWLELVHPEDVEAVKNMMQQLHEGQACYFNNRYRHKDGSYRQLSWSLRCSEDGYCYAIARDVTAHKPLELTRDITEYKHVQEAVHTNAEMLDCLLEHTPAAIAMFDKDMNYQLVSRRFLEDFDLSDQDIIGKSNYEVFPEIPQRWKAGHQRCLQGAVERREEDLFIRANGEKQWVKWEIRPWTSSSGEISGLILVSEIITEQRQAKEKLRRLNEKLLHSNRDLEQFAYVASHDLQEPLRAMTSYSQLLARRYQGNLDAKADKYIQYIVEGAIRMQQLINDLLSFSRVGTHGKELKLIACELVLSKVLDNLKVAITQSHAVVTHDPLPTVMGDETQLIQLFQNLIGNAIKFRRDEPPQVHISAVERENEWAFEVRDNGIGIEPEYFERIFTIFQRLHSRSEYPGTGIGLAVCKKIVERHGGRIWVESTPGVGTTFHFTILQKRQ